MTTEAPPSAGRGGGGVHGRLVQALGARIVSGQLSPGDALPTEAQLVEEFGSSRSSIREAVKVLTAKGLVVARTKAGTVVQPQSGWNLLDPDLLAWRYNGEPSIAQLDDLAGLRVALEPEAARLAATGKDRRKVAEIRAAYGRMEATLADPDEFIEHDLAFHRAVVEASGNQLLVQLNSLLLVAFGAARQFHARNVRRNRRTVPAHLGVVEAIERRDAEEAAGLMRALVQSAQHDIHRERVNSRQSSRSGK
jgi:GntR family transcriptional regulator, galactonate operon transcriptional repressor